ncbi:DUF1534 domain-containing protein [Pseudomonas syringae pv. tomato]|nr:DUF1534 domain-containing protein [Pseudomonas syringae pv. tomato]
MTLLRRKSLPRRTFKIGRGASRTACDAERRTIVEISYPIHEPHISSHWLTPDAVLPFSFRSQHHDATRRQSRESLPLSQTRGFQKIHRWLSCFGRVGY